MYCAVNITAEATKKPKNDGRRARENHVQVLSFPSCSPDRMNKDHLVFLFLQSGYMSGHLFKSTFSCWTLVPSLTLGTSSFIPSCFWIFLWVLGLTVTHHVTIPPQSPHRLLQCEHIMHMTNSSKLNQNTPHIFIRTEYDANCNQTGSCWDKSMSLTFNHDLNNFKC